MLSARFWANAAVVRSIPNAGMANLPAANGDSIYVETHGNPVGPTIIFTHGWGLDSTIWQAVKEDFDDFRLVLWDLPGMGKSKAARPVTLDRLAEGLEAVMTWAGDGP